MYERPSLKRRYFRFGLSHQKSKTLVKRRKYWATARTHFYASFWVKKWEKNEKIRLGGLDRSGQGSSKLIFFRLVISYISLILYVQYVIIKNFSLDPNLHAVLEIFIVRPHKDIPRPRFSALLPFWGSRGPVRVLICDGVLVLSRSDTSSDHLVRLRQLVSFSSVNLVLKQNLCI